MTGSPLRAALSRTVVARDHALIAPEGHVAVALHGWSGAVGATLIAPAMGARFSLSLARLEPGGRVGAAPPGVGRIVYVLDGAVRLTVAGVARDLAAGGYAYLPADTAGELVASADSRLCLIEKPYVALPGKPAPRLVVGSERDVFPAPLPGSTGVMVRELLPADLSFDLAVNVMEYAPGAALPFVESHVMEHGLVMLEGSMVYRLGSSWYPVAEGDALWMAPFCPQWCCAFGPGPARYLIYKDWNRDPLA